MEPNRFDDVEIRILEAPEEPRPPRRPQRRFGHAALAAIAAFALAGSLAAGASALTSTAQAPTREVSQLDTRDGWQSKRDGWHGKRDGWCRKGDKHRRSSVRY